MTKEVSFNGNCGNAAMYNRDHNNISTDQIVEIENDDDVDIFNNDNSSKSYTSENIVATNVDMETDNLLEMNVATEGFTSVIDESTILEENLKAGIDSDSKESTNSALFKSIDNLLPNASNSKENIKANCNSTAVEMFMSTPINGKENVVVCTDLNESEVKPEQTLGPGVAIDSYTDDSNEVIFISEDVTDECVLPSSQSLNLEEEMRTWNVMVSTWREMKKRRSEQLILKSKSNRQEVNDGEERTATKSPSFDSTSSILLSGSRNEIPKPQSLMRDHQQHEIDSENREAIIDDSDNEYGLVLVPADPPVSNSKSDDDNGDLIHGAEVTNVAVNDGLTAVQSVIEMTNSADNNLLKRRYLDNDDYVSGGGKRRKLDQSVDLDSQQNLLIKPQVDRLQTDVPKNCSIIDESNENDREFEMAAKRHQRARSSSLSSLEDVPDEIGNTQSPKKQITTGVSSNAENRNNEYIKRKYLKKVKVFEEFVPFKDNKRLDLERRVLMTDGIFIWPKSLLSGCLKNYDVSDFIEVLQQYGPHDKHQKQNRLNLLYYCLDKMCENSLIVSDYFQIKRIDIYMKRSKIPEDICLNLHIDVNLYEECLWRKSTGPKLGLMWCAKACPKEMIKILQLLREYVDQLQRHKQLRSSNSNSDDDLSDL